jgi:hypothetical protein
VPENEIAVVTPYQAQVSLISEMIHEEYPTMTIGSVDGLQGQEREVSTVHMWNLHADGQAIILSLVRSNTSGEVGFLSEYRRLNVAMTRAKRQLVSDDLHHMHALLTIVRCRRLFDSRSGKQVPEELDGVVGSICGCPLCRRRADLGLENRRSPRPTHPSAFIVCMKVYTQTSTMATVRPRHLVSQFHQ